MVDFQSRDTRRGVGGDDDDDEEESDESQSADDGAAGTQSDDRSADEAAADDAATEESVTVESEAEPTADTAGETQAPDGETDPELDDRETGSTDPLAEQGPDTAPTEESDPAAAPAGPDGQAGAGQPGGASGSSAESRTAGPPGGKTTAGGRRAEAAASADHTTPDVIPAAVAVVTVGTTTDGGDPTGDAVVSSLEGAGHTVPTRERLRGDYDSVQGVVDTLVGREDVDVVVIAGGTGVREDEVTIEAVHPLFAKALPGFGEVFRDILAEEIGTGVVAVRATAGIADGVPVFCIPGDAEIATLAVREVIAEEGGRLADHLP